MFIDIACLIALVVALFKGFQKGLIVAVFSLLGFLIGLMAALKLSTLVASWLVASTNINTKWLPVLAFLLVFLVVMLLVRLGAKLLEGAVELVMLGWVNKAGGILLYAALYALIISILLFFTEQLQLLSKETVQESVMYPWIQPLGPGFINTVGVLLPVFKDIFHDLENFFQQLQGKLTA